MGLIGMVKTSFGKQVCFNKKQQKKKIDKSGFEWKKTVGLGFKTPKSAINGHYRDKKCPFTSTVGISGRILTGIIQSTKMHRSVVIRRDYSHYLKKYQRYERRHSNITAHLSPCFRCREGDTVAIGQCRPLSKTIKFNVLRIIRSPLKSIS